MIKKSYTLIFNNKLINAYLLVIIKIFKINIHGDELRIKKI